MQRLGRDGRRTREAYRLTGRPAGAVALQLLLPAATERSPDAQKRQDLSDGTGDGKVMEDGGQDASGQPEQCADGGVRQQIAGSGARWRQSHMTHACRTQGRAS